MRANFISITLLFCQLVQQLRAGIFSRKQEIQDFSKTGYGVDISFPIHHPIDGNISPYWKKAYDDHMAGCYKFYSKRECDATERARMEMSKSQPATQVNYTEIGFKKIRLPKEAWDPLIEYYNENKHGEEAEKWGRGNTYVNNWVAPTMMVSFENKNFRGGKELKAHLWDICKPIIEEWTGKRVEQTSLYGIRIYR